MIYRQGNANDTLESLVSGDGDLQQSRLGGIVGLRSDLSPQADFGQRQICFGCALLVSIIPCRMSSRNTDSA